MKKNRLLNIALGICKFTKLIYILSFIAFTCLFIHFQIDRNYYNETHIKVNSSDIEFKFSDKWGESANKSDENVFALNNITTTTIYAIYIKFSLVIIMIFMITNEFQKIIQSVKTLNTFKKNNVISFKKIGKYTLIYFLLTCYTVIDYHEGSKGQLQISFIPLILILISFIMAEIFKEGNILMEENELTV